MRLLVYVFTAICTANCINPSVKIFGGGIGGLSALTALVESGKFDVDLYEQSKKFGGKMIGYIDHNGYAREHSLRLYIEKYYILGHIFDKIGLKPPTMNRKKSPTFKELELAVMVTQKGGLAGNTEDQVRSMLLLGFSPLEFQYFIFKIWAFENLPTETINKLYTVSFKSFINDFAYDQWVALNNCTESDTFVYCKRKHTRAFQRYLETAMSAIIVGKPKDSIPGIMYSFAAAFRGEENSLRNLPKFKQCQQYYKYFSGKFVATGPTSLKVIDPWVEHIQQLQSDVNPKKKLFMYAKSKLVKFVTNGNKIEYAVVKKNGKKEKVKADVYIVALPTKTAESLLPGITQRRYMSERWLFSIQFYLPCLPDSFQSLYYNRSRVSTVWDGGYDMSFMFQTPQNGIWEGADIQFKEGIEYVMSVTAGNIDKPSLNGKQFKLSTRREVMSDILAQIKFPNTVTCRGKNRTFTYNHNKLINKAKLGISLHNVKEEHYQHGKNRKYRDAAVGPLTTDGRRWILDSPLYLNVPDANPISPLTKYDNLVLAGEYVSSPLVNIVSMGHAAESGFIAAQAAVDITNVDYKVPKVATLLDLVNVTTVREYGLKVQQGIYTGMC